MLFKWEGNSENTGEVAVTNRNSEKIFLIVKQEFKQEALKNLRKYLFGTGKDVLLGCAN